MTLDRREKQLLIERIERACFKMADEAFDPETAEDSDGYAQAEREGIIQAMNACRNIVRAFR
jgi:hypothetical protein